MVKRSTADRFWSFVDDTEGPDGCWHWCGYTMPNGYGVFRLRSACVLVHRWVWEHYNGPIPTELVIDHLCHNRDPSCEGGIFCWHRRCVNPSHIEPVPLAVNLERGRKRVEK